MNQVFQEAINQAKKIEANRNVMYGSVQELDIFQDESGGQKISFGDKVYELTDQALRSLCYVLGVPFSVETFLSKNHPDFRKAIYKRIQENSDLRIQAITDNGNMQAVVPEGILVYSNTDFLTRLWEYLPEGIKADIGDGGDYCSINVGVDNTTIILKSPQQSEILDNKDLFRIGLVLSNSSVYNAPVNGRVAYERMFCTNLCYTSERTQVYRMRHQGRTGDELREFLSRPIQEVFSDNWQEGLRQKLESMRNTHMSLSELIDYRRYLGRLMTDDEKPKLGKLEDKLPILGVLKAYGIELEEFTSRTSLTSKWRATAKTPITPYYLFDLVTQEARHNKLLTEDERDELRLFSGELLGRSWDLDETAPDVKFDTYLERYEPQMVASNN